jgi:tetratricopeptide (TPR) repeat protein
MEWLLANWVQVVLAVAIALGAGAIIYKRNVDAVEKEETAAEDLLAAIYPEFEVDTVDLTKPVYERLRKVAQDYPETKAANNAVFLEASALYGEGEFAKAKAAFSSYLNLAGTGPLSAAAQFGLAAAEDADGEKEKAESSYKVVISSYSTAPEAMQARVALAKILLDKPNPEIEQAKQLLLAASQESQAGRIPGFWGREAERMLVPLQGKTETKPDMGGESSGDTNGTKENK